MRVLDFHVHVGKRCHLTPRFTTYFEENYGADLLALMDGLTPDSFSRFLEQEEVDKAVLLSEYSPNSTGTVPCEYVSDFCSNRSKLIPFGSIDLGSGEDSGTQCQRYVTELGCKGIKLLPSYGHYHPSDKRLLPAYETASDFSIPVMFHTGTSLFPGTRVRYADPLLIDEVAEDFPSLKIVLSHGGRPFWYKESEWMLRRHEHVYIDISGIPLKQLPMIFPKIEMLRDKFIFGSDWPNITSIRAQVQQIIDLKLSRAATEAILWENGNRLLGI